MTERIYKVQSDSTGRSLLIYDMTRQHQWQGELTGPLRKSLGLRRPMMKRYFWGQLDGEGRINLDPQREVDADDAGF